MGEDVNSIEEEDEVMDSQDQEDGFMVSDFHLSVDEYQFSQEDKQQEILARKLKCQNLLNQVSHSGKPSVQVCLDEYTAVTFSVFPVTLCKSEKLKVSIEQFKYEIL